MKKKHYLVWSFAAALAMMTMNSCSDENTPSEEKKKEPFESDAKYFGQEVGNFKAEE